MERTLEIRFGRECKMYTLWMITISENFCNERYIKNLSTNYDEAIEKSNKYNKMGISLLIDAPENLNDIVRGDDVLRFGKYKDKRISEINDIKYLKWIFGGCAIPNKDNGIWYPTKSNTDPIVIKVKEYLLNIGEAVLYNDRIVTLDHYLKIKKLEEKYSKSEFVGEIGKRLTFEDLTVDKITSIFDSMFNTIIYNFIDKNGNFIVTKRSNYLDKIVDIKCSITNKIFKSNDKILNELISIGVNDGRCHTITSGCDTKINNQILSYDFTNIKRANYFNLKTNEVYNLVFDSNDTILEKGDIVNIKGTIKEHTTYKDTKQTKLSRVTII